MLCPKIENQIFWSAATNPQEDWPGQTGLTTGHKSQAFHRI